ncbi:MAG: hypothetical protein JW719_00325 [Pirellulales bacterium]|nr:hypothetical protein [Pirellulales bacterium]
MQFLSRKWFLLVLLGFSSILLTALVAPGAVVVWDGGSMVDDYFTTAENWVGDVAPASTDDLQFDGDVRTNPVSDDVFPTYNSLAFNATASAFTVDSFDPITLAATTYTIVNNSAVLQTINAPVAFAAGAQIRATAGNLALGNVTLGGATRFYGDGFTTTINGNLTGTSAITTGSGTVVLTADNTATYTAGAITIDNNSVLRLTASGAAGANDSTEASMIYITGASTEGGTLELEGGITIDKWIKLQSRSGDYVDVSHIRSTGNNTLRGRIYTRAGGSNHNIESVSGLLTIESLFDQILSGARLVRFGGEGDIKIAGTMTGNSTIADSSWRVGKIGAGTLTYDSSTISYFGDTGVFGGTLEVTATAGSALALSPKITVASGATLDVSATGLALSDTQYLQGSGIVVGNVAASSLTTISPGTISNAVVWEYTEAAGTLQVNGNLDLSAGANVIWNLAALSEANPGTDFDTLTVSGDMTLGATSTLTLDFAVLPEELRPDYATPDVFWGSDRSWKIVDVDDAAILTGDFATLVNDSFAGVGTFDTRVSGNEIFLDFDSVYNPLPPVPGDTDNNRIVNELDAAKVAQNWGISVTGGFADGDFNDDDLVNAADAAIQAANWGDHTGSESASTVPEPGMIALLLGLTLVVLPRRTGR